jgi:hypothetical protein
VRRLEDLRLIIGLLFAILGVLVLIAAPGARPAVGGGVNADLVGGILMVAFAALMILLAFFAPLRDQAPPKDE